ncbi:MAG: hypothetical protein KAI55_02355, partial [Candidatus Aenigmarchaeota archaeon]|nr:hypothetical protein [Candidatus Aenigmarchaeota archaeon]
LINVSFLDVMKIFVIVVLGLCLLFTWGFWVYCGFWFFCKPKTKHFWLWNLVLFGFFIANKFEKKIVINQNYLKNPKDKKKLKQANFLTKNTKKFSCCI